MKAVFCCIVAGAVLPLSAVAQVPKDQLLVPPAEADKYVVISSAGQHGTASIWQQDDGTIAIRESILLRGFVWETDETIHVAANGLPDRIVVRGETPEGNAAETFSIVDGQATWKSQIDYASVPYDGQSLYSTAGGPWVSTGYYAEALYRAPEKRMSLLPAGEARMARLIEIAVGSGANAKTVTAWAIEGVSLEPIPILMNADGSFFGFVGEIMAILPPAYRDDFPKLQREQSEALSARYSVIARRFGGVPAIPVAFTQVKLFDSEAGRFFNDQTVVVDAGKIAAVGPSRRVKVPTDAKVIEGTGMTLTPGIWDSHQHVISDAQGVMLLSLGVTSLRNPGVVMQLALLRNTRIAKGELLFPTIYSSVGIDGKGPLQAQIAISVASAEEAIAAVRSAKSGGFTAIKIYGSMKPEWLKPVIAEAKELGLHIHGHVPATMRPTDAIAAGYDEITHINFVMMQAMSDSVVAISNGLARIQGPGRYAKDVDISAEPLKSLIAEMAAKKITVDPTLAVFERAYVAEHGDLSPAYAPFVGTMPPLDERSFRTGGDAPPEGVTRSDYRASFAKMVHLTGALHEAGVQIVAGTDGSGLEIVRELELYVDAGLTPAEALQTATIGPARLVGADKTTGSITVGKEADVVLVEGDPEANIGAMRHTVWVMSDGALMNADDLREAAGFKSPLK